MDIIEVREEITNLPLRRFVDINIFGRYTMHDMDGHILATLMGMCSGDHIEIGVAHGGSAILCAYAKRWMKVEGHIYAIDPLEGYGAPRTPIPPPPTMEAVMANIELHKLEDKITVYKGYHPPLPPELRGHKFDTCLIDGDHSFEATLADWLNLKDKVRGVVAFHDVHNPREGCNTVFEIACRDKDWEFLHRDALMGLVKKKGFELTIQEELLKRVNPNYEAENTLDTAGDALEEEDGLQGKVKESANG